jgi:hypothetical protein
MCARQRLLLTTAVKPKLSESRHRIGIEMAIRVMRVLKDYDVSISASADPDLNYISAAVKILQAIGNDIGLCLSAVTWRDLIAEAKQATPDLQ